MGDDRSLDRDQPALRPAEALKRTIVTVVPLDLSLLELLAAKYVLAELPVDDLPRLATDALVAGVESESLAALAGAERVTTAVLEECRRIVAGVERP